MAVLNPSLEVIVKAKQKPTEGELFLLRFLETHFGEHVEVYFQPCFNGDRPDIILMSQKLGVVIIEVKDWNLESYRVDDNNKWIVSSINQPVKSPFQQAFAYKKNFFDMHINGLLEKSLKNSKFFGIIKTYVYFHLVKKYQILSLYEPHIARLRDQSRSNSDAFTSKAIDFDTYEKGREWIERRRRQFERDSAMSLHQENLDKIVFPFLHKDKTFEDGVYTEFKRLLSPPFHYASEGKPPKYSEKQSKLIKSVANSRSKICGLAGSGKTVVLAGRAVDAYKRHGGTVLVLTYNITLCSYIHDRISTVREDFPWSSFDINNYHRFITIALNNAGIEIEIPDSLQYDGPDPLIGRRIARERDEYLEKSYYSNQKLFEGTHIGRKYQTILIDEVQDYRPEWIKIIRSTFLEDGGEMLLFGDEKQNIYKRALDTDRRSKVVEGFGSWIKLMKSFRYKDRSPIIPLVDAFQKSFLLQDYELDEDEAFQLNLLGVGVHAHGRFEKTGLTKLAEEVIRIAKYYNVHPNDIAVISSQEKLLQELDLAFRKSGAHSERTLCTFPSAEVASHPKYSKSYQKISALKKKAFNLNSGLMKLSSTHSFKGFESPFVFLLVNNNDSPEMVFTGLTRAKESLVVYLEAGCPYFAFFQKHLSEIEML